MTSMSAGAAQLQPDLDDLARAILESLARVRAAPVGELREEMAAVGGDLEIDSREAEAVIAMLEKQYGRTLATVEDLDPECLASIDSLADLIYQRWPTGQPIALSGSQ
jgi:acyl carrier protein